MSGPLGPMRGRRAREVRTGALLTLALSVGGCATTLPLSVAPPPDGAVVRFLDHRAEGRTGCVAMEDSVFLASGIRLDPVGMEVSFRSFSGDSVAVPVRRIRTMEFTNPARGVLEGFGAAALTALAVGGIAAAVDDGQGERSRGQQALRAGGIAAVFVLPVGFVIGIGGGHRTVIQVQAGGPG